MIERHFPSLSQPLPGGRGSESPSCVYSHSPSRDRQGAVYFQSNTDEAFVSNPRASAFNLRLMVLTSTSRSTPTSSSFPAIAILSGTLRRNPRLC